MKHPNRNRPPDLTTVTPTEKTRGARLTSPEDRQTHVKLQKHMLISTQTWLAQLPSPGGTPLPRTGSPPCSRGRCPRAGRAGPGRGPPPAHSGCRCAPPDTHRNGSCPCPRIARPPDTDVPAAPLGGVENGIRHRDPNTQLLLSAPITAPCWHQSPGSHPHRPSHGTHPFRWKFSVPNTHDFDAHTSSVTHTIPAVPW